MEENIKSTTIKDLVELCPKKFGDERGQFISAYKKQDSIFQFSWASRNIAQVNISITKSVGAIRGLHFQSFPSQESKFVRCIKGKIFDVIVDIRKDSKTFGKWQSIILDSKTQNMVFIPSGFAHGFQTLLPDCEILYLLTDFVCMFDLK